MSERGAGGKGGKSKGSSIWEQLKSMGRGVLDGLSIGGTEGGAQGGAVQRKVDRTDPVARERQAAAMQIHRSLKAWRDRDAEDTVNTVDDEDEGALQADAAAKDGPASDPTQSEAAATEKETPTVARKVFLAPKGGRRKGTGGGAPLPALDSTGKVHGDLPRVADLGKYDVEELEALLVQLRQSVQRRIQVTSTMGRERNHGQRQGDEQALIPAIERHLESRR